MPTFTTVIDKAAGDTWTAAMWNTYLRDNLNGLLTKPMVVARRTTTITASANVDTQVTLDAEDYDTDGMHSTSSNTARLTATTAGLYLVTFMARIYYGGGAGGTYSRTTIYKNGTTTIAGRQTILGTGSDALYTTVSALVALAATDYVQTYIQTGAGGGPMVYSGAVFHACWVGRYS